MKEHFPNYSMRPILTLILKPKKDVTRKENYRPTSLMNIDAETLNNVSANQIQQHKNGLYTTTKWDSY